MSDLAALTREVEGLLAEIGKLARPAHESRQVIARALGTLNLNARDPEVRRGALRQQDQLSRADRILTQAMLSCGQSVQTGRQWLALHAAHGGGGGGGAVEQAIGAADLGEATGTLAARAGAMPGASRAAKQLANAAACVPTTTGDGVARGGNFASREYGKFADRHGRIDRADQYMFGGVSALVAGAFSHPIEESAKELLTAVGLGMLPPPVGFLAVAAIRIGAKYFIEKGSERGTGVESPTATIPQQLVRFTRGKADWTPGQWASAVASVGIPVALGAALATAGAPLLLTAVAGGAVETLVWVNRQQSQDRHSHTSGKR